MASPHGPTLETYVETRFNLIDERLKQQDIIFRDHIAALDRLHTEQETSQKAYWAAQHIALSDRVTSALNGIEVAITKVEASTERRFASVNEFRGTLSDQAREFIPRREVEAMRDGIVLRVDALKEILDRLLAERMGIKGGWGYAVGVVGFVLTLLTLLAFVMRNSMALGSS